jgi:hypothetical protein
VILVADKDYDQGKNNDASENLPQPIDFIVPANLSVTGGESGTGWTGLSYRDADTGDDIECCYQGPAADATRYQLQACIDADGACDDPDTWSTVNVDGGDTATSSRFGLHVYNGDPDEGTTEVTATLICVGGG